MARFFKKYSQKYIKPIDMALESRLGDVRMG